MPKIEIEPALLQWALDRSGRAEVVAQKFPKLGEWLERRDQPTLRQLEDFARAAHVPLGYLFLDQKPEDQLPIPLFRTQNGDQFGRPSADLVETVQLMQRRQAWARDFLADEGDQPLSFIGSAKSTAAPTLVADNIREVLQIKHGWASAHGTWTDAFRNLLERMEQASILAVVNGIVGNNTSRKLNPNEFRGFVLVDEYAPLIFVNGADFKAAQIFTLAHELAHLWIGSSAAFDLRELRPADDDNERACDRIAAEFLVPESELRQIWSELQQRPNLFEAIAQRFKVSQIVAARRTLDLGLISKDDFHEFYSQFAQNERRKSAKVASGGDFYANQNFRVGRRFAEIVIRATVEGKLLYRDAYQLTGLFGDTFQKYATSIAGVNPPA